MEHSWPMALSSSTGNLEREIMFTTFGIIWLVAVSYVAVCLYMSLPTSGLVASCLCTLTVPEFTQQVFDAITNLTHGRRDSWVPALETWSAKSRSLHLVSFGWLQSAMWQYVFTCLYPPLGSWHPACEHLQFLNSPSKCLMRSARETAHLEKVGRLGRVSSNLFQKASNL